MKKVLVIMAIALSFSTAQAQFADSTSKDAVEAYSDTTSVDTSQANNSKVTINIGNGAVGVSKTWNGDSKEDAIEKFLNSFSANDLAGMLLILGMAFILFVLAPVLIIIALFYFINKNRKQKLQIAQMAVQNGQPIPEQLLNDKETDTDDEYQKGMRQCFVGVGLMIFLGYAAGNVGFGIGALVFCIGLGKVFASKTAQKKKDQLEKWNDRG